MADMGTIIAAAGVIVPVATVSIVAAIKQSIRLSTHVAEDNIIHQEVKEDLREIKADVKKLLSRPPLSVR